jgi:hypothetical protein
MVVFDDERIFPNKIDPFDWFICTRIRSYFDYTQSRRTQGNFDSLLEARQLRGDARVLSQQIRSARLFYT